MAVPFDEQHSNCPLMKDPLEKVGITPLVLAKIIKKEFKAKVRIKIYDREGNLVMVKIKDAPEIAQRARMDVQKLLGLYPTEKFEMDSNVMVEVIDRYVKGSEDNG